MNNFVGSVWWLIVSLGVLVTFHEFGHYWVARRCGVKVLRFSVGFGKALWSRVGRDGTEYMIAAIPLGGYVKMLDEREGDVATADLPHAFNRQPVGRRIAIVIAGPLANLLLCVAMLWGMFVIGRPDFAPVLGHVEGIAASAGLERGDTVLAVGTRGTPTWSEAALALATAAMDRSDVTVRVHRADGATVERKLRLSLLPVGFDQRRALQLLGVTPRHQLLPPQVGRIEPGAPAWGVLAEDDFITAVDGQPVAAFDDIGPLVQQIGRRAAMVEVRRDGERLALEITPQRRTDPDTFLTEFPVLTHEAVALLARAGVRLVGVDAPSMDPIDAKELAIHHALGNAGIANVENLALDRAPAGACELMAFPIAWGELDAAPVRAVVRT